tara:strand:+ start:1983 stop:2636 length:654 start_codon:yes stop_codon:yes gene_type:complete
MAYAPTKTWISNDVVNASDLLDNLDGVKNYLNKLPDASLAAGNWVNTNHIMKGFYEPTINCATFVSGITGGKVFNYNNTDYTYATGYNTLRKGASSRCVHVPKSSMDFEITSPSSILYHYWMCPLTLNNDDGVLGHTDIFIWKGNLSNPQSITRARSLEEDKTTANFAEWENIYFLSGTHLVTGLSVGTYHIGLAALSTTSKTSMIAWGYSAEVFAM